MMIPNSHVKANRQGLGNFTNCDADDFFSPKFKATDTFEGHTCKKNNKESKKKQKKRMPANEKFPSKS